MSSVFHFRCSTPCVPRQAGTLIIFSGPSAYDRNAVADAITEETRRAVAPEAAYLLYPNHVVSAAATDLAENLDVFAPLADDTAIGIYGYDQKGTVSRHSVLRKAPPKQFPLAAALRQGLTTLFRRHGGALDAGFTAHFIRPSARPSSRFLRASHALADGAEIFFAAFGLLGFLPEDVEFVHLDTSAIASVILAALILRRASNLPTLRTFHSYEGLAKHPFSIDRADLVLISASQSGTMAQQISTRVADAKRIITLFSSADPAPGTRVLCDIRYDELLNSDGFQPPNELSGPLYTRPIRLIGEHFLVEPEPPRSVVPTKNDPPLIVASILANLAGQKALLALKQTDVADARMSVWVDMQVLKNTEDFKLWIRTIANQRIPATTRALVRIDDDAQSRVLSDAILAAIEQQGGKLSKIIQLTLSDLESGTRNWVDPSSPIVITGATAGHGTQLLAVSRALRRYAPASHRIYLAPGTISSSERAFTLLSKNLQQPTFTFDTMFQLIIDRERASGSWNDERLLLDYFQQVGAANHFETRLADLNSHPEGRLDGLFLDSPSGQLQLRDNFAFWPSHAKCTQASQADVFTTICALLEHMRSPKAKPEQRLINDTHTHTLVGAETFSRYNDGIIQAAFLRAALPIELDYRDTPDDSRLLVELLRQMIKYADRQQGEALGEFLLALACGRMRLTANDFEKIVGILSGELTGATPMAKSLARCLALRPQDLPFNRAAQ